MSRTGKTVIDGKISNEELGAYFRKTNEILRRINERTLDYGWVMDQLQFTVENRVCNRNSQFKPWKTIELGTHKTVGELKTAIKRSNFRLFEEADEILKKSNIPLSEKKMRVDLYKIQNKPKTTYEEICSKAFSHGFLLCPREVALQLRRQYPDQPYGEQLHVATEPIVRTVRSAHLPYDVSLKFRLEHDGLWVSYNDYFDSSSEFIFMRRS